MEEKWTYPKYKTYQKEMRATASRWFEEHRYDVQAKYPFILLNKKDWKRNIILPEVRKYVVDVRRAREAEKRGFPFHMYIHHGLSSQAMLFNLVGPLIVRDDLKAMAEPFKSAGLPWPSRSVVAELEIEDRDLFNERQAQPTSIDLAIGTKNGWRIFVESKLVEQEFGGCSAFEVGDCDGRNPASRHANCYLHCVGRTYWTCLKKHGFLKSKMLTSPICLLANYYQYFREVVFTLEKNGFLAFLVDSRNPVFVAPGENGLRGLIPFLALFLPARVVERVRIVTIQDVVAAIERSRRHSDWIDGFRQKYGIYIGE